MLPRNWLVLLVLLFSLVSGKNVLSQTETAPYAVRCRDMLQIVTNSGAEFQGELYFNNGDSLMIFALPKGLSVFAMSDISTISICRRRTAEGAIFGSLAGLAVGLLFSASLEFPLDAPEGKVALAVGGASLGALFGALNGSSRYKCTAILPFALPKCTLQDIPQVTSAYVSFAVNW
jgi:hypothetical protein